MVPIVELRGAIPVAVSMDCLSGETLGKSLPYMARGGYWIVIATLAGVETNVLLRPLLTKGLHLVGSTLRSRKPEYKAFILSQLVEKVWPKIESGQLKPSIYQVLPQLIELWGLNTQTEIESKKNFAQLTAR